MASIAENFGDILAPGFRKIFSDSYNSVPSQKDSLYSLDTSDKEYEKDSSVGSFGDMEPFDGTIGYDDVNQGYDVTYTQCEFAKGFKIARRLYQYDLYRIMNNKPKGLGLSAARTKEKYAASPFVNAFTSTSIVVGGTTVLSNTESLSLCNDSHTTTASSSTQDNKITSALSPTSLAAARVAMSKFKDDRGNYITVVPDTLVVPIDLGDLADEIVGSKGKPNSAENNMNVDFGRYQVLKWHYLTDANDWFLVDTKLSKGGMLNWITSVPVEFFQEKDFDTLMAKFAAYEAYAFGWSDWRFLIGSLVA